ncbi:hypothetical protein A3F02_02695 [Candidatus Curtissbacteria bacterium RIFCSPHIGHO2_12_FULL_38_9b]|uniref:Uncharacterized protein n=1 Tax=Candidatus Curtissbacteria bacterium RIFCSPHIGHO2_12_FULL_38_9b TaxID=1797720 RepID=A0A1F5GTG0_9BACT|nr:MAG: hypothetical protein A3F02_02695 [Candidatus Curtissbacteria bacterium RIFCSPHIGHO2_12_FULL_38_9b]
MTKISLFLNNIRPNYLNWGIFLSLFHRPAFVKTSARQAPTDKSLTLSPFLWTPPRRHRYALRKVF